jgi:tetratricopeptide (TPR) repeat protein
MNARWTALVPALALTLGCGASRDSAYTAAAAPEAATADEALVAQADALWEQRHDGDKLKEALALYEKAVAQQPDNRVLMGTLARGYYLLACGHLKTEEERLEAHDRGARWGERLLGLQPAFRQKIEAGAKDYEALDTLTAAEVPGLYWAYANLARWSAIKGFTTVVKNKSKLKAFIDRVAELQPEFYHGAADRGLGAFYAKAPSFAGGDLNRSKEHFDRSMSAAPDYFGTKVLMAELYAVKRQDRALFESLLGDVIAGDPKSVPDAYAMQVVDQKRAKELLVQAEDLFE